MISYIIVKDKNADEEKIKNFWTPVKLKYETRPQVEFIITDNLNEGIQISKYKMLFITPWNMVPTYKTMITLEQIKGNMCLLPTIHNSNEQSGAYSISKDLYKGESIDVLKQRKDLKQITNTTMYRV